ncbi:hypothetical protein ACIQ9E_16590 [Streptomyces sp. NPDC094448]|uniref:hypothetical protein n=1 Tax=Streptomyces sp. NPDC094448 TaxID=3366063 RepID=UPI0038305C57
MTSQTPHSTTSRRLAVSAGLTVAAFAAALGTGSAAQAAPVTLPVGGEALGSALSGPGAGVTDALTNSVQGIAYLKEHQLNPLAGTGTDPLANGVATQIADFKPIGTDLVTGPLADGAALQDLPIVGKLVKVLPL